MQVSVHVSSNTTTTTTPNPHHTPPPPMLVAYRGTQPGRVAPPCSPPSAHLARPNRVCFTLRPMPRSRRQVGACSRTRSRPLAILREGINARPHPPPPPPPDWPLSLPSGNLRVHGGSPHESHGAPSGPAAASGVGGSRVFSGFFLGFFWGRAPPPPPQTPSPSSGGRACPQPPPAPQPQALKPSPKTPKMVVSRPRYMGKVKRSLLTTNLLLTGVFLFCWLFVSAHTSTWWHIAPFVMCCIVSSLPRAGHLSDLFPGLNVTEGTFSPQTVAPQTLAVRPSMHCNLRSCVCLSSVCDTA